MPANPPSERYRSALAAQGYSSDPAQERAIDSLDRVWSELQAVQQRGAVSHLLARIFKAKPRGEPVTGLYLWGGVGRGKTFLMDIFFRALPFDDKLRLHFHRFMQQVHGELKTLGHAEDPLQIVAGRIAAKARIICFDEFFVSDIADAMILGRLFHYLFENGVTLVATSNIPPSELYKDGLQRARFLPAIGLIQKHCEVLSVDAGIDYRLRTLERAEIYHWPSDKAAEKVMEKYFDELNPEEEWATEGIEINGRKISVRRLGEGVVWFDFEALCQSHRSASDYIELAREFHSVLLSRVPQMDGTLENEARRFVTLVDEFYDRHVKLILSATVPLGSLYTGERLTFEFQRTFSRLQEMQSHEYLSQAHRP